MAIADHGTRLGLRFRADGAMEPWLYGSTLVTPRVGFCVAFGC
ncbi:MAG: hypothetical protein Q8S33_36330 [Myxococcales bacterium]|nr:hypothetical protein [Myxococcales bacterium]